MELGVTVGKRKSELLVVYALVLSIGSFLNFEVGATERENIPHSCQQESQYENSDSPEEFEEFVRELIEYGEYCPCTFCVKTLDGDRMISGFLIENKFKDVTRHILLDESFKIIDVIKI